MTPYRVVVTGLGVVSPNGIGQQAFWSALRLGRSGVRLISLFDPHQLPVRIAAQIPDLPVPDVIPEKLKPHLSRATQMALLASGEALQDACLTQSPRQLDSSRTGVLVGTGGASYEFLERQLKLYFAGRKRECSIYAVAIATMGTLASDLSTTFQLRGPSHVISTGCTSSSDALGYAFQLIRWGELDACLVGGVDAPITPVTLEGFHVMRVLSRKWQAEPEKASRPFSRDRDGFVLGEGAWFFFLERLEHALSRGARIYAELLGYSSTCEAFHRVRLHEKPQETARAIQQALQQAQLPPEAIDYIQYHGTATPLNDRIETRAIKLALGRHAYRVAGSSVKSMIGHPQGASGAAGLATVILAMKHNILPPTMNLEVPDPECDLDYVPHHPRAARIEFALVNCLGFGSKSSALIVRRWPD